MPLALKLSSYLSRRTQMWTTEDSLGFYIISSSSHIAFRKCSLYNSDSLNRQFLSGPGFPRILCEIYRYWSFSKCIYTFLPLILTLINANFPIDVSTNISFFQQIQVLWHWILFSLSSLGCQEGLKLCLILYFFFVLLLANSFCSVIIPSHWTETGSVVCIAHCAILLKCHYLFVVEVELFYL